MHEGPDVVDADGSWRVRADPDDVGVDREWWRVSTDDAAWVPAEVPGAWQAVLGERYAGVAWLRGTVRLPASWRRRASGERLWLRMDAVATDCRAWVNGVAVGSHVGDYAPFQLDVTGAVGEASGLELALRVDQIAAP
ncbi:MAG: sugar-binding domain-containing protein, partial [Planctomycetota bacterium]